MITDHHFKMNRSTKIALATMDMTSDERGAFKKLMVAAQVHAEHTHRMMLKSNNSDKGDRGSKEGE